MNILAIDYGTKRIGLAWMQADLDIVLPFGVIETRNWKQSAQGGSASGGEIAKIVTEEKIDKVLVGYPLNAKGEDTDTTIAVHAFVEELQKQINVPIELVDERFTTSQAKQMGGDATLDEKAAMLILQTYLDKKT